MCEDMDYSVDELSDVDEFIDECEQEILEENPLEDLELPEVEVEETSETFQISPAELEWAVEQYGMDAVAEAVREGKLEPIGDSEEDADQKVLTRNPEISYEKEFDETLINYEGILQGIEEESLCQGFEEINVEMDAERLETALENFTDENWGQMSLEEQKGAMENLANYVKDTIQLENPPEIEYYYNESYGDYGGYNRTDNVLRVNEYMLDNAEEAADTIAHELWHAHQFECAENPQSALDYQYRYNIENYISSDMGQEAYENQLIEAEARAFAEQFKERIGR